MSITIAKLARRCGVSTATVSLVLNNKDRGRVSVARREQIRRLAARHGYRSNVAAKGLVEGRTYRIGVVVEGRLADHALIGQFSFYHRLGLLGDRLRARGYLMELCQVDPRRRPAEIARELAGAGADAFILLAWSAPAAVRVLRALRGRKIPAVACGTALADPVSRWVDVDRRASIRAAVRHLARLGHREIVYLDVSVRPSPQEPVRTRAFQDAVRAESGRDGRSWVFASATDRLTDAVATVERALVKRPGAQAFLLADNLHADLVLDLLGKHGLEPGGSCHVLGFGDTALARRCRPPVSHYSLQNEAQVEFCVETLLRVLGGSDRTGPRHLLLPPRFVAGGTCPA